MSDLNSNLTDRVPARQNIGLTEIFLHTDFPAPVSEVVTLGTGVWDIKADIFMSDRLVIDPAAGFVQIISTTFGSARLVYTGLDTYLTHKAPGSVLVLKDIFFVTVNDDTAILDIDGGAGLIIENASFQGTFGMNGQTVGRIANLSRGGQMERVSLNVFDDGIIIDSNSAFTLIGGGSGVGLTADFTSYSFEGTNGRVQIREALGETQTATHNLFYVDPISTGPINILTSFQDGGNFFQSLGTSGDITGFADASEASESITSITDSSGVARFNFTAPPTLFVGQEVVIVGFVTNTDYNGTFIITATGANFFEVSSIAFGSDEAGGTFTSASVTVTATANTLSELDTLRIAVSINYNGGFAIYNRLTNSFQINSAFTAETIEDQTYNSNSLDETDPRVSVALSAPQKSSKNIASVKVVNSASTFVPGTSFGSFDFGGDAVAGDSMEQWQLLDSTTGRIRYNGEAPFAGLLSAVFLIDTNSAKSFNITFEKNAGLIADETGDVNLSKATQMILVAEITAVKDDEFEPQILVDSGSPTVGTPWVVYTIE